MTHRKRTSILLVISFVLILVGSFFSNAINTDFGKIKTDRLYLMNDNGYTVSARIYIPKTATLNSTPFVRQYDILSNKWGVLLCQKEYQTNDIRRSSRKWL